MPETKAPIERLALTDRKNAGRGGDTPVPHDHSSIVERGFRMENRQQQLDGKVRIDDHAGLFVNPDGGIAFDGDERADGKKTTLRAFCASA